MDRQVKYVEMNLDLLKEIVAKHCPVLRIHPSDTYLPSTAEFFLENSSLCCGPSDGPADRQQELFLQGGLDSWGLVEAQANYVEGKPLFLKLDPNARTGMPKDVLNTVPFYVVPKVVDVENGAPTVLEISYVFLYPYNGPYRLGFGAHDGDWEHITMRVSLSSAALLGVWYNAHRSRDGQWVAPEGVPLDLRTGRILAFVARHGHGTYPRPGTVLRHVGLGNDVTANKGPSWDPDRIVLLPFSRGPAPKPPLPNQEKVEATVWKVEVCPGRGSELLVEEDEGEGVAQEQPELILHPNSLPLVSVSEECPWLWFRGQWGQTDAPAQQSWFHSAECPVSRSAFKRAFGHFYPEVDSI